VANIITIFEQAKQLEIMKKLMKLLHDLPYPIDCNIIPEHQQFRIELSRNNVHFNNFVVDKDNRYFISFENSEDFKETTIEKIKKYLDNVANPKVVQVLPKAQKEIIQKALGLYQKILEDVVEEDDEKGTYKIFDLFTLNAIMECEIKIELSAEEKNNFTHKHGVDFPNYIN
jgi:hypothetical protein